MACGVLCRVNANSGISTGEREEIRQEGGEDDLRCSTEFRSNAGWRCGENVLKSEEG